VINAEGRQERAHPMVAFLASSLDFALSLLFKIAKCARIE
jgi:hypothetical protein